MDFAAIFSNCYKKKKTKKNFPWQIEAEHVLNIVLVFSGISARMFLWKVFLSKKKVYHIQSNCKRTWIYSEVMSTLLIHYYHIIVIGNAHVSFQSLLGVSYLHGTCHLHLSDYINSAFVLLFGYLFTFPISTLGVANQGWWKMQTKTHRMIPIWVYRIYRSTY